MKHLFPILALVLLCRAPVGAQMLMASARQMSEGSIKLSVYYQGTYSQDLKFTSVGVAYVSTMPAGGPLFPSGYAVDADVEGKGGGIFLKCTVQPWENLRYYALAGVGHYDLKIPSVTVVNSLSGDRPGVTYGAGVRWLAVPDTVVTPAVTVDLSFLRSEFFLDDFSQEGAGGRTLSQRLTLSQVQLALYASHRFGVWQPYGGVKWLRTKADLKNLSSGEEIGGIKDTTTPFIGLEIHAFKHESLVCEVSFVNGIQFGAGLGMRF